MTLSRVSIRLSGGLQGVGFRPFVYRLAQSIGLEGWVKNTGQGVELELEGPDEEIRKFESRLVTELPSPGFIRRLERTDVSVKREGRFQILQSENEGDRSADILPDIAVCQRCIQDTLDPHNRRYRYPFTSCAFCGPRYSVITQLPYDRENTTMREFSMCEACAIEYSDPSSRRFHSQINCCPLCGPRLSFCDQKGSLLEVGDSAFLAAVEAIRYGQIIAIKGVGGFHLVCDARADSAVLKLREKKGRKSKPFAVMVTSLNQAKEICEISSFENELLRSPGGPIVLLKKNSSAVISQWVSPDLPSLGIMLPYSPLHFLLLNELKTPLVATSGNISDEPIAVDEKEALLRLTGVAEGFLFHNRAIASRADDSIVREIAGTQVVLRAGRGYSPFVLETKNQLPTCKSFIIGMGAHMKASIACGDSEGRIILFPHQGDLNTLTATQAYEKDLRHLIDVRRIKEPEIACDLHPDYRTSQLARKMSCSPIPIQHHQAHLLSCIAEHKISGKIFGVSWDGTGYGMDGTIWGGEFFLGNAERLSHIGRLRQFSLPGGDSAVKDARKSALGILYEIFGENCKQEALKVGFKKSELQVLLKALNRSLNSPRTSSAGRLFDAVSALTGVCHQVEYEGQAAMKLELIVDDLNLAECAEYPVQISGGPLAIIDWEPWICGILNDLAAGMSVSLISAKFHRTLAQTICAMAKRAGVSQVVLSGGCFQNRVLCEWTLSKLRESGFHPYWNQSIPPNDGGIAVGQIMGGRNVLVNSR